MDDAQLRPDRDKCSRQIHCNILAARTKSGRISSQKFSVMVPVQDGINQMILC